VPRAGSFARKHLWASSAHSIDAFTCTAACITSDLGVNNAGLRRNATRALFDSGLAFWQCPSISLMGQMPGVSWAWSPMLWVSSGIMQGSLRQARRVHRQIEPAAPRAA